MRLGIFFNPPLIPRSEWDTVSACYVKCRKDTAHRKVRPEAAITRRLAAALWFGPRTEGAQSCCESQYLPAAEAFERTPRSVLTRKSVGTSVAIYDEYVALSRLCWRQSHLAQTEGVAELLRKMAGEYQEKAAKLDTSKLTGLERKDVA